MLCSSFFFNFQEFQFVFKKFLENSPKFKAPNSHIENTICKLMLVRTILTILKCRYNVDLFIEFFIFI